MVETRRCLKLNASILDDLPLDMLLLILSLLNNTDRLSLSLVSKSLRALINQFVHKLDFNTRLPTHSTFRKLFARFSSVRRIAIKSTKIFRALTAIADSGLQIEILEIYGKPSFPKVDQMASLKGRLGEVKGLKFGRFKNVNASKVIDFVHLFQSLQVLDLSQPAYYCWTDNGIYKLLSKCRNLRKVCLEDHMSLTDRSLDAFATSCVNLEEIRFDGRLGMSFQGVWDLLLKAKNLKSLALRNGLLPTEEEVRNLTLVMTEPIYQNLSHLSIEGELITDASLVAFASLRFPLTSFELKMDICKDHSYTMTGLSAMLRAYPGLNRLHVHLPCPWADSPTQDFEMSQLVKSLPYLKDIYLVSWSAAYETLFSLIENCPLLECIHMESLYPNTHWDMAEQIKRSYSIQHIYIDPWPADTLFKTVLKSSCPLSVFEDIMGSI